MLVLFACTDPDTFPCSEQEWLDSYGNCHPAPLASDEGDTGGTADDTGADSGAVDSGGDSGDDSGQDTDTGEDTGEDSGLPADDGWPAHFVAPYVDATGYPTVKVGEIPAENGVYHYTLGFVVASSATACDASWGTYYTIETGPSAWESGSEYFLYDQIDILRAAGGDVMVSFGGAANTPIDAACSSVSETIDQYVRVIEKLNLTRIDFDIEGSWVSDTESIARRSEAIAGLQAWAGETGRPLHVWYTLPVLPAGLTADGVAVVQSAIDAGVLLDGVNVMTMDYGDGVAPSPEAQMGEYGILAVQALKAQLSALYPGKSDSELWAMVGSTPMIGQNDVQSEVFDTEDAEQTVDFARANGLGMLGFWSINRDHPCAEPVEWAQSTCSGYADVPDWAFAEVFAGGE